jgi:hypothetical protein
MLGVLGRVLGRRRWRPMRVGERVAAVVDVISGPVREQQGVGTVRVRARDAVLFPHMHARLVKPLERPEDDAARHGAQPANGPRMPRAAWHLERRHRRVGPRPLGRPQSGGAAVAAAATAAAAAAGATAWCALALTRQRGREKVVVASLQVVIDRRLACQIVLSLVLVHVLHILAPTRAVPVAHPIGTRHAAAATPAAAAPAAAFVTPSAALTFVYARELPQRIERVSLVLERGPAVAFLEARKLLPPDGRLQCEEAQQTRRPEALASVAGAARGQADEASSIKVGRRWQEHAIPHDAKHAYSRANTQTRIEMTRLAHQLVQRPVLAEIALIRLVVGLSCSARRGLGVVLIVGVLGLVIAVVRHVVLVLVLFNLYDALGRPPCGRWRLGR